MIAVVVVVAVVIVVVEEVMCLFVVPSEAQKSTLVSMELKIHVVLSFLLCILGTEFRFSTRVVQCS